VRIFREDMLVCLFVPEAVSGGCGELGWFSLVERSGREMLQGMTKFVSGGN